MLISIFLKGDLRTFFGNWKDLESTKLVDLGIVLFDFVFIFSNVKLLLIQLIIRVKGWKFDKELYPLVVKKMGLLKMYNIIFSFFPFFIKNLLEHEQR